MALSCREVRRRADAATGDADGVTQALLVQMQRYVLVFILFYAFGLLNRLVHLIIAEVHCHRINREDGENSDETNCSPPVVWPLVWLHVILVPLQGFGNAVVYGGLPAAVAEWLVGLHLPAWVPRGLLEWSFLDMPVGPDGSLPEVPKLPMWPFLLVAPSSLLVIGWRLVLLCLEDLRGLARSEFDYLVPSSEEGRLY